jgi:hypothetical protein
MTRTELAEVPPAVALVGSTPHSAALLLPVLFSHESYFEMVRVETGSVIGRGRYIVYRMLYLARR